MNEETHNFRMKGGVEVTDEMVDQWGEDADNGIYHGEPGELIIGEALKPPSEYNKRSGNNFRTELEAKIAELVPEALSEGQISFSMLADLISGGEIEDKAMRSERFGLVWPGMGNAFRAAQTKTTATLTPNVEKSKNWDDTKNIFIEGDNLETLKILQNHYYNKVKLIYIDPPYNTGNDFIYKDDYSDGVGSYMKWTKQVNEDGKKLSSNTEIEGRYHSNWLNMMFPRIKLARNMLKEDGLIFISIDDNELDNLKKMCDIVFGESNRLGTITVINKPGGNLSSFFNKANDFLLVYAKNKDLANIGGLSGGKDYEKAFNKSDELGKYRETVLMRQGPNGRREDAPTLFYPIYYNDETKKFSLEPFDGATEIYPISDIGVEHNWRWSKNKVQENIETELTARNNGKRWVIAYKDRYIRNGEVRTVRPKTVWSDSKYSTPAGTRVTKELFSGVNPASYPKPLGLLEDIILMSTNEDDIVMDFFAGSGSTGHAVMKVNAEHGGNRTYIQVQIPEPVDTSVEAGVTAKELGLNTLTDISRKRLDLAGTQILKENDTPELDVGYRVYELTDSHFRKWGAQPGMTNAEVIAEMRLMVNDPFTADASPDSLATEILLNKGFSLTENVKLVDIAGIETRVLYDADGKVKALIYSDVDVENITTPGLREALKLKPELIIFLDAVFHGDDNLKINLVNDCKYADEEIEFYTK